MLDIEDLSTFHLSKLRWNCLSTGLIDFFFVFKLNDEMKVDKEEGKENKGK